MKTTAVCLAALFLFSCSGNKTSFADEAELQAYVNDPDNGYIQSTESGDFIVETKLVPAINEDKEPQFTVHIRLSRKDGRAVLESGGAGRQEIMEREAYLSFDMLGAVYFENGEDIVPPVFHHYERNYGLKPSVDLYFDFKQFKPVSGNATLVIRDELFGQGMFRIPFNQALFTTCHVEK